MSLLSEAWTLQERLQKVCTSVDKQKSVKQKNPLRQLKKEQQLPWDAMLISHALLAKSRIDWIVDSGATCQMCNDQTMFSEITQLGPDEKLTLGDGSSLSVPGKGRVNMDMILSDGMRREYALKKVFYVLELAYNLVSVSRATEAGKKIHFCDLRSEFGNEKDEVIVLGTRQENLCYVNLRRKSSGAVNVI